MESPTESTSRSEHGDEDRIEVIVSVSEMPARESSVGSGPDCRETASASTDEVRVLGLDVQYVEKSEKSHAKNAYQSSPLTSRGKDVPSATAQEIGTSRMGRPWGADIGVPGLDPTLPGFDFREWATRVLCSKDTAKLQMRRASVIFKNLDVSGSANTTTAQTTVSSALIAPFQLKNCAGLRNRPEKKILSSFAGLLKPGELLLVLGRPGSGCSTFLKTIAGVLDRLKVSEDSVIQYSGILQKEMVENFKGELNYNAEIDTHFPHLTVGETLEFAAASRTPSNRILAASRKENVQRTTEVVMAVCGLTHTRNTKVGNDIVRGVSGGERKRVSIAEMMLANCPVGSWDNSTRGLDAATALAFARSLRMSAEILGAAHAVAIYQASQDIYDVFDKVIVLYEGLEIFFGPTHAAKAYFERMGWHCPPRQTTGDFLTSITNHEERTAVDGYEHLVPRTPQEFEKHWRASEEYRILQEEIELQQSADADPSLGDRFRASHYAAQSKHIRQKSPYTVSVPMQIRICLRRAYRRLWNDKASTLTVVTGQIIMALIVGSVFFGTPNNTSSFFSRGSTLFFATLLNALIAVTEINGLYQQRPIVEKQASFAFCRPGAEALAGIIMDAPVKLVIATCFNLILYFLAGLRREPAQFFIFFLFTLLIRFTMSAMFRTVAAVTKTVSQAMAIAGVLVLVIVIYTGYTIPRPYMHPWFKWLSWINPLAYTFESLMVNEFHGRYFPCANVVPAYPNVSGNTFICPIAGAVAGQATVSGDAYVEASFQYSYSHIWRNLGIGIGFYAFFLVSYVLASELNSSTVKPAEVLLFRRGHLAQRRTYPTMELSAREDSKSNLAPSKGTNGDTMKQKVSSPVQKSVFTWRDLVYDIHIKDEPRRLLDNVCGWVKPGTLTALMGVSGAGKTTLLDVLAQRTSIGIITGDMFVNGKPLSPSFQRKSGYVQQQDVHLETATVREALRFSAMLRQASSVTKEEKYSHVEDVIQMLDMTDYAEAIIGIPGEGLNVEQRKLLSIGVELAAKPALLLFLDEPTSGLDSNSSWAIVKFLRRLADNGQAVLSTIHQPSATLFEQFDQLLFLARGGRTVYFGDIGQNAQKLLGYFESNGARQCGKSENPAEYILELVSAGASGASGYDWPAIWKSSDNCRLVREELDRIHREMSNLNLETTEDSDLEEFAMPLTTQLFYTTVRVYQQYWRTPSYVWGKILLGVTAALFIGFSFFEPDSSLQGLQNVVFSIFMLTSILSSLVQQIIPRFVMQRSLYEVRERPSKMYSWIAFVFANILAEITYQIFLGILVYVCYYYAIFGVQSSERQVLILLFCIQVFTFASTFAHMIIAAMPDAQTAGAVATLLFSVTMIFNGVFQPPQDLPGFWIFMYRVSPLTYIVGGVAATGLHGHMVHCSTTEVDVFDPPQGMTCAAYLQSYLTQAPGQLYNPGDTANCRYCPLTNSDQFLAHSSISWDDRWRNFGIAWAYVLFNISAAMALYYIFRVKQWRKPSRQNWWKKPSQWLQQAKHYCTVLLIGQAEIDSKANRGVTTRLF